MRTMRHEWLNEIANEPEVRRWLGGEGPIDLAGMIGRPGNYCFANDDGGFVVHLLDQGLYEVHTIFRPDKNLRELVKLMHKAQEFMFIETDCQRLITKAPATNEGAIWLCKMGRFDFASERKDAWAPGVDMRYYNLPLDRWAHACYPALRVVGASFHDAIARAKVLHGVTDPLHPEDEFHDVRVGLAYNMIAAGNTAKGVDTYNKWALQFGYVPIKVVWPLPVVIDTGDAVIQVRNGAMEILLCR